MNKKIRPGRLYEMPVVPRAGLLWLGFMVALWSVFAVGLLTHPQDWIHVRMVEADVGWNVFWYILRNNLMLALLIIGGNLFVRFGRITPGVVILVIQAIIIGWTAGTNSFAEPFATVHAANIAFLRIGLWETTAYVLMCGATLNKSLFMAETFPAKTWAKITKWNEVAFTRTEIVISILALLSLLGAAYTEAFFPLPVR